MMEIPEELLGKEVVIFVPGTETYKFNVYLHWFRCKVWLTSFERKKQWIKIGNPLPVPQYEGQIFGIKEEFKSKLPEELKEFIEAGVPVGFFIRDYCAIASNYSFPVSILRAK